MSSTTQSHADAPSAGGPAKLASCWFCGHERFDDDGLVYEGGRGADEVRIRVSRCPACAEAHRSARFLSILVFVLIILPAMGLVIWWGWQPGGLLRGGWSWVDGELVHTPARRKLGLVAVLLAGMPGVLLARLLAWVRLKSAGTRPLKAANHHPDVQRHGARRVS